MSQYSMLEIVNLNGNKINVGLTRGISGKCEINIGNERFQFDGKDNFAVFKKYGINNKQISSLSYMFNMRSLNNGLMLESGVLHLYDKVIDNNQNLPVVKQQESKSEKTIIVDDVEDDEEDGEDEEEDDMLKEDNSEDSVEDEQEDDNDGNDM